MALRRRSFLLISVAVVAGCSVLGGIFGPGLARTATAASLDDDVRAAVKSFTRVYSLVERNFAQPVDPAQAILKGAVPGMLHTLDPHSSFFDRREFSLLRENQRGHYFGVGMSVGLSRTGNGKTIVIAPFPGAPAYKAGLRPGDEILAVDDKPCDKLSLNAIVDLLKGPKGTRVKVTIGREGSETPLSFEMVRDEIPRKAVQDAFWVKPGIAYIGIDSFQSEETSRELEDNLRRIGEPNVQGLIIDLRDNLGGLLSEGVAVAGRFLKKGQLIVSHRGRASADKPYVSRTGDGGYDYPIVVLVNRYSASAAEIVAGALQDHDRAWILGENTFGKGLVQTVYPLSGDTGLALTTARYYTPSGRLIQRDYSNVSFYDYYFRKDTAARNPLDAKSTDSGRLVYGGGGIAPDETFAEPKLDRFQAQLTRKFAFFNFVSHYLGTHRAKLAPGWEPGENVVSEFRRFLQQQGFSFSEADFTQDLGWTKLQLKREMYGSAFSIEDARRLAVETDPEVAKAVEAMPKARALLESAKKVIAQRLARSR